MEDFCFACALEDHVCRCSKPGSDVISPRFFVGKVKSKDSSKSFFKTDMRWDVKRRYRLYRDPGTGKRSHCYLRLLHGGNPTFSFVGKKASQKAKIRLANRKLTLSILELRTRLYKRRQLCIRYSAATCKTYLHARIAKRLATPLIHS